MLRLTEALGQLYYRQCGQFGKTSVYCGYEMPEGNFCHVLHYYQDLAILTINFKPLR